MYASHCILPTSRLYRLCCSWSSGASSSAVPFMCDTRGCSTPHLPNPYLELIWSLIRVCQILFESLFKAYFDLIFQLRVHLAASGWIAPRHRATFVACRLAWQPSEAKKMAITACEVRRNCVLTSLATTDMALISCARFRKIDFIRSACSKNLCNTAVAKQPLFMVYLFFHHLGPQKYVLEIRPK